MASGYDTRPAARESFAFAGTPAAQVRPSATGASNGARVVGGNATGEAVLSGPQTNPGDSSGELGQFFGQLMQPYIERKQKEQFFRGYTAATHGVAITELAHSDSPINKIFGPTGFEQGAQFFTANSALDKFSTSILEDMDNFKKLPPEEAAKALSAKSDQMMTGDSGTNMLIQSGLIERMGPVLNTVAKARVEWQQTTAKDAYTTSRDDAGSAYQAVMSAQSQLTSPTDENRLAAQQATSNYMAGAAKPEGMTDETYGKALAASAKSDIIAGNFYAVGVMKRAGAWKFMDEETQNKLDTAYATQSSKALSRAAFAVVPDLIALHASIKTENVPGGAMGAAAELARINGKVKGIVGTDDDLFDYKDLDSTAGSVVDVLVAGQRRLEARQEQLTDMATRRGWQIEDRDADAAAKAATKAQDTAQTVAMWGIGDITGALAVNPALGKDFNAIALSEVRQGNTKGILHAWQTSKWVSPAAATQLQTAVTSAIGDEYNADIGKSHEQWAALYKQSPSVAAAYYGDMQAPMMRFDTLLRTNSPQTAFSKAFGDPLIYHPAAIPKERLAEANKMIPAAISSTEAGWWQHGEAAYLNASGLATTTAILTNRVATLAIGDHTLSTQALVNQALASAQADNSIERIGAFAWGNRPGTPSLQVLTGLHDQDLRETFTAVVDYRMKKAGYRQGASGADYMITRMALPNGHPAIYIEGVSEDGSGSKQTIITVADLQAYAQHKRDERFIRSGNAPRGGTGAAKIIFDRYQAYKAAYPE